MGKVHSVIFDPKELEVYSKPSIIIKSEVTLFMRKLTEEFGLTLVDESNPWHSMGN